MLPHESPDWPLIVRRIDQAKRAAQTPFLRKEPATKHLSFLLLLFIAGCAIPVGDTQRDNLRPEPAFAKTTRPKIQHVVIVIMENRTLDNLFQGFPGADTQNHCWDHGKYVPLQPVHMWDAGALGHDHANFIADYDNGKLDGFATATPSVGETACGYVYPDETATYWQLAKQYVLADHMFQSNQGPSFGAHQMLIAGQDGNTLSNPYLPLTATTVDFPDARPWGCDGPANESIQVWTAAAPINGVRASVPCFDYTTLGDLMDAAHVSWRYYSRANGADEDAISIWSAYDAIRHIRYGPDWQTNIITPNTQFFTDVENGQMANLSWITPAGSYSDHPGYGNATMAPGEDFVADIVNTVGRSQYWDSTAIFVVWDDWGGWFDHVPPPPGLGFRVPLLVISPWAKRGYVLHNHAEFGSILRFVEEQFGLPLLGTDTHDALAPGDLWDAFDYTRTPGAFVAFPSAHGIDYFANLRDDSPADDD